jgi:beta-mannosidase
VLASFKALADGAVELWVTNDTLAPIAETVTVRLGTFGGEPIWEEGCPVAVPANSSRPVRRWNAAQVAATPDRYLAVRSPTDRFPANRHFFAPIKDLRRAPVAPATAVIPVNDHELRVEVTAPPDGYAFFVHVRVPDHTTRFSDNYFDLEPGERRAIVVTNEERPLAPEAVSVGWR